MIARSWFPKHETAQNLIDEMRIIRNHIHSIYVHLTLEDAAKLFFHNFFSKDISRHLFGEITRNLTSEVFIIKNYDDSILKFMSSEGVLQCYFFLY